MIGNSYNLIFLYLFPVLVFLTQSRRTGLQSRTHSAVSYTKFVDVNLYCITLYLSVDYWIFARGFSVYLSIMTNFEPALYASICVFIPFGKSSHL